MKTKKISRWAVAVLAVLTSCTREALEEEVTLVPAPARQVYRFELAEEETRATLTEEGVFWETGDQVGLFVGSAASVAADVDAASTPKTISYPASAPVPAGTPVYAYYPYQAGNTDATAARIVFPSAQTGGSSSSMPMAGVPVRLQEGASAGVIRFLNLGAVIDFRVYSARHAGETVRSITFTATSGDHPVCGEATMDLTSASTASELSWSASATNPSSVILTQTATVAASKDAAAAGNLFMVVAPGTYSGTITIVTTAATYTFPFENKTLERNTLKRYNMNLDSAAATREAWYVKVRSMDEVVSGGKYLIVYEAAPCAFKPIRNGNTMTASTSNKLSVTIENDRIRSTDDVDACQVIFEKSGNNYQMKAVAADGYYFYPASNNITATQTPTNNSACTVTNNAGVVNITAGTNYYFKYSTNSGYFKQSTSNNSRELALYLLDDGTSDRQYLQFSAPSYTFFLNGLSVPVALPGTPTLTGNKTSVTYTSGNTSVATVDASTGIVTARGTGTTVITATAAGVNGYQAATASYTLSVWEEATYSIENEKMAAYLNAVEANPYNPPADYDMTYMTSELYGGNTNQTNRLDWPKPVPVSWTNPASGNGTKVVYVYNDEARTSLELSVTGIGASATSADVYNLIPNRTYYYTVTNNGQTLSTGKFKTVGRRRMIKVAESTYGKAYANNCRDFGGQKTLDGKTVRYGKMFRGSNLDKTSAEAKAFLKDYLKVGLDVDLRTTHSSWGGNTPGGGENILYDALGLGDWHTTQTFDSWGDLSDVTKIKAVLTKIFQAVAEGKGVYIHCTVGADRTGYVSMLLEALLGVPQGWCDVDYELTSFSGAVDSGQPRSRTGSPVNHYYRTKNGTVQGVDFIYSLSGGSYGSTFQAKAVNYVVNTLDIPESYVTAFQNAMLED